jgi:hypothetical protein
MTTKTITAKDGDSTVDKPNPDYFNWVTHDQALVDYLFSSFTHKVLQGVFTLTTSAVVWSALDGMFAMAVQRQLLLHRCSHSWSWDVRVSRRLWLEQSWTWTRAHWRVRSISGGRGGGGYSNNQLRAPGISSYGGQSRPRCQACMKIGHIMATCWYRFDEDFVPDNRMAAMTSSLPTGPNWHLDSGGH